MCCNNGRILTSLAVVLRQSWIRVEEEIVFLCKVFMWMGCGMEKAVVACAACVIVSYDVGGNRILLHFSQDC